MTWRVNPTLHITPTRDIAQARVTDEWIPLPGRTLTALGWTEGDILSLEVLGDTLLVTRISAALTPDREPPPRGKSVR